MFSVLPQRFVYWKGNRNGQIYYLDLSYSTTVSNLLDLQLDKNYDSYGHQNVVADVGPLDGSVGVANLMSSSDKLDLFSCYSIEN